jgi:Uri superfamily endonuclease
MNDELNSGSYQLFINVNRKINISVGALGKCIIPKGKYVYTGSAMKNLRQRVERHIRRNTDKEKKKTHWHIDYLITDNNVVIDKIKMYPSYKKEECKRNQDLLRQKNTSIPIPGFGSSDCRNCISHLVRII